MAQHRGGRLGTQGQGFGLSSTTVSLNPNLDLQVMAAVQRSSLYASDALGARYRRPLGEGLVGGVGLDLFGGGSPYTVGAGFNQTLTWQAQNLDFLQSYSGIPAAGLHTLGLAGGTRSIYSLGVRGNTSLRVSPSDTVWYSNLSLYSQVAPGVLLSLGGQYRQDRQSTTWGISPALGWSFLARGIGYGGLSLSYGYTGVLAGPGPDSDLYQSSLSLGFDRGQLGLQARYERKGDQRTTEGQVGLRYTIAPYGFLEGRYTFALLPGGTERYTYGAFWENTWVGGLVSRLEYEQRLSIGPGGTHLERVAFGLRQRDFLSPGIVVGGVYGIQTDQGLFYPGATLTHTLSFSLGYELNWSFDTPRPVVDFFGGRKSGEVYGVVFQDRNLNGEQDPGEEGLEAALERGENLWSGRLRLSPKTRPGLLRLEVQAQNATGTASSQVLLNVIAGSLFTFESAPASAKESTTLHFRLRFRPGRAELLLPDATRIPLTSQDGYLWSAPYTAPEGPGPVEARLLADGEELGKVTIKSR